MRAMEAEHIDTRQRDYKDNHDSLVRYQLTLGVDDSVFMKLKTNNTATLSQQLADIPQSKLRALSIGSHRVTKVKDTTAEINSPGV